MDFQRLRILGLTVFVAIFGFQINALALKTPVPLKPTSQQISGTSSVKFSWSAISLATGYRLSIAKAADVNFENPVYDKILPTTSVTVSLASNAYRWTVRAQKSSTNSPWSPQISFSVNTTGTSPAPTSTPTPSPTPASSVMSKGMWTWYDSDIATVTLQNQMLDFAVQKGVNVIYIHSQSLLKNSPKLLADFIALAATKKISVELLFGASEWALTGNHQIVLDIVAQCNSFVNSLSGAKPVGLHFDIEPHGLPNWSTDSVSLGNQLVDLYGKVRAAMLPGMYLNADIAMGYEYVSISRNGQTKTLSQWLVDETDRTTLMSYRDYALGDDSITSHSVHPINYALSLGKTVIVGVETECLQDPPKVSFCEEGQAFMESELSKTRSYFSGNSAFGGVGIHHYRPYKALKP